MELCFEESIDQHPKWQEEGIRAMQEYYARKLVAHEWYKHVHEHFDADYAHAVGWCLNRATFDDPSWRVDFAKNVVGPVERSHQYCLGNSQPRA